jgi:hypothetical protein
MMRKSYLQQQIEGLALVLARLLGLDGKERHLALDRSCRDLTGLDLETLLRLDDQTVLAMFRTGDRTRAAANAYVAAALLLLRAEADPNVARSARRRALLLFAEAMARESALHRPDLRERFETLAEGFADDEKTPLLRRLLWEAYEATGALARAENELYALRDGEEPGIVGEARAFYGRLATLDDATLIAGGLPRDEIIAAQQELNTP